MHNVKGDSRLTEGEGGSPLEDPSDNPDPENKAGQALCPPPCSASSISEDELAFWRNIEKEYEEYNKKYPDPNFISGTRHPLDSQEDVRVWQNVIQNLYESRNGPLHLSLEVRGGNNQ